MLESLIIIHLHRERQGSRTWRQQPENSGPTAGVWNVKVAVVRAGG